MNNIRFDIEIAAIRNRLSAEIAMLDGKQGILNRMPELSEGAHINANGNSLWIHTAAREDVERVISAGERGAIWSKERGLYTDEIDYTGEIEAIPVRICTREGALPPTCKLVEKEVTLPALPERKEKRMVVECEKASGVEEAIPFLTPSPVPAAGVPAQ